MGLTSSSTGKHSIDEGLVIKKQAPTDKIIALAGNPNVGKSTVFNGLTGMNQHTGNWPGKTVSTAHGYCKTADHSFVLVDLPGTYSLLAHSAEEEVARNFICFGEPDAVIVVCDSTCIERNMNLVLQTLEICPNVIMCLNLIDEAKKKNIFIDSGELSKRLGIPVVCTSARQTKTLKQLTDALDIMISKNDVCPMQLNNSTYKRAADLIRYPAPVEEAISTVENVLAKRASKDINARWFALKLLEDDVQLNREIYAYLGINASCLFREELEEAALEAQNILKENDISSEKLKDVIVTSIVDVADRICNGAVIYSTPPGLDKDRKIDRVLTSKLGGYPIMLALLAAVMWITITGANYPSELISHGLNWVEMKITECFELLNAPDWLYGILVLGMFRVLAWVVSVMLPPMAIFFPFFTLLEDLGYLPRIAYNLDRPFKRCSACGKQALTMCMGFGCNAAGIVGCRIIDSPRERLLAILTNNFVPCNGRFPTLITLITIFFVGTAGGILSAGLSALLLTGIILLGIVATFMVTKFLSKTILKGLPSSFTLELPPYRKPQIGKVIVRSIFDRTLFVLGRAVVVAAPAGIFIWIMANLTVEGADGPVTLLNYCAEQLDPFAQLMGLDGVILIAFILGFPANEIVIPIVIMAYMSQGSLLELDNLWDLKSLFVENGWTQMTAISTMLFSLFHWPCSTTLLTIKKETKSWKWTVLAALIPTLIGVVLCIAVNGVVGLCSHNF